MPQLKEGFLGERAIKLPQMVTEQMPHDPFLSNLYITDIGYYPCAEYHYRRREKPIDEHVLIYCTSGRGEYTIGRESYAVGENQFFILPAGKPHSYRADSRDPWTIYWIHFNGKLSSEFVGDTAAPIGITPSQQSRISDRVELFEEIFSTLSNGYNIENLKYSSMLLYHFLGTLRYVSLFRTSNNNSVGDDLIEASIHYMKENIERQITLQMLAEYTGYSATHFTKLFKQKTGYSPMNYFNLLKMQKACFMLGESNIKINQVSRKLGINDPYYFSRLFTKIVGLPPTDYREHLKQ